MRATYPAAQLVGPQMNRLLGTPCSRCGTAVADPAGSADSSSGNSGKAHVLGGEDGQQFPRDRRHAGDSIRQAADRILQTCCGPVARCQMLVSAANSQ